LDEEIKELQALKKSLKTAKEIVLTTGAEIFIEYGIEKIDGAGISSITLTKATTSDKTQLIIEDAQPLINEGFYTKVLDEEKLREHYDDPRYCNLIKEHTHLDVISTPKPAKIKINKRKSINNANHTDIKEVA